MRPRLDRFTRQILPLFIVSTSACLASEQPVPNELNSMVDEPLVNLPEIDATSPFRSVSRPRTVAPDDQQGRLTQLVEEAVDSTRRRLLSTEINSPWQIMHGLLALRHDFQIKRDGQIVSGLDWVSSGPSYEGQPWFEKTRFGGRAHPYSRPWAFEGHANQFLAVLSMSALPLNHQFQTSNGPITIADMVEHAQKAISSKDEPTWTLWALSRYLPSDATWRNAGGEAWSIERLVSIQTGKPLKGSACGGTHGMFALAHARNVYLRTRQPLRGVWLEAEYKIRRQINTARVQQNSNGMLSSNYFRGRDYKHDFNKRMASAGHILEFLMISLPQDELQERWVRRAIEATARDLLKNRKAEVRCSPLYHAVNALNIYLDRMKLQQPTQVASNADSDAQLKPADEKAASGLKSVPAASISDTKPLMTEVKPRVTGSPAEQPPADSGADSEADAGLAATAAADAPADQPKFDPADDASAADSPLILPAPNGTNNDEDKPQQPSSEIDETATNDSQQPTSEDAASGSEASDTSVDDSAAQKSDDNDTEDSDGESSAD